MLDQAVKIIERVLDSVIMSHVDINSMQFGVMPGWGTTDEILFYASYKRNIQVNIC